MLSLVENNFIALDGTVFNNFEELEIYEVSHNLKSISKEDIDKALKYMNEKINCKTIDESCNCQFSCATCSYKHFQWVMSELCKKYMNENF